MLSRRSKINLALSTLVLLLAAGVYLTPDKNVGERLVPLTGINPADISRIQIRGQQEGLIVLEKQGSDWIMTSPYQAGADADRINGLSRIASTHSHLRIPADNLELGAYGLAAPIGFIDVNGTELAFGSTEPVHKRRYVLVEGSINLIDDGFYHHLMAKPEGFVAKPSAQDSAGAVEEGSTTESQRAQRLHYEKAR